MEEEELTPFQYFLRQRIGKAIVIGILLATIPIVLVPIVSFLTFSSDSSKPASAGDTRPTKQRSIKIKDQIFIGLFTSQENLKFLPIMSRLWTNKFRESNIYGGMVYLSSFPLHAVRYPVIKTGMEFVSSINKTITVFMNESRALWLLVTQVSAYIDYDKVYKLLSHLNHIYNPMADKVVFYEEDSYIFMSRAAAKKRILPQENTEDKLLGFRRATCEGILPCNTSAITLFKNECLSLAKLCL